MNFKIETGYRGMLRLATVVISVVMVIYHMWAIGFGSPEAVWFRGTHLLFAMVLTFLIFRVTGKGEGAPSPADYVLLVLGALPILYLFANYDYIVNRIFYVDELTLMDKIMGVMMDAHGAGSDAPRARLGHADHRDRVSVLRPRRRAA